MGGPPACPGLDSSNDSSRPGHDLVLDSSPDSSRTRSRQSTKGNPLIILRRDESIDESSLRSPYSISSRSTEY